MRSKQQSFGSIETAIAKLGYPDVIWFRGHVAEHRLVPSLFRFPGGAKNESKLFELYKQHSSDKNGKGSEYEHETLFDMHNNYFPTRLIAWTESLHVAIFCALVRESHNAAIFILNPVALNACSKIIGITKLNPFTHSHYDLCVADQARLPEYPVAINSNLKDTEETGTEKIFTLHGTNEFPLEEQCPNCVVKVVLTREEQSFAENGILSGMWLP